MIAALLHARSLPCSSLRCDKKSCDRHRGRSNFELGTQVPFYEIATLVLLAAAVGLVGLMARQPLVVAFIAVGVLAGPDVLGLVAASELIETLSQISIAVLLFLVGLKLDLSLVRSLGRVAVATGVGQVTFTALIGFVLCLALGIDWLTALYVSVALTFSSTIIISSCSRTSRRSTRSTAASPWASSSVRTSSWCSRWSRSRLSVSARRARRAACSS